MTQCVPPHPPAPGGAAAGGGLSAPGTHRPARCSYPSSPAQNSSHPGEEELASTSTPAEGSGRPTAPLGVRAPERGPWGVRWLPESQRVKGSYLRLEVRGCRQRRHHSAVCQCLLPTPAGGRGSYPAWGGPCHFRSPARSGLWSSAVRPGPPPPSAPQTSGSAGARWGKRPPNPSRSGLWQRARMGGAQPENARLPLPSRPGVMSDDSVATPGLAMALAPVGKSLDEEDTV